MIGDPLVNNLWVLLAGLLVFVMTMAVGFLEVGELGKRLSYSLLKTMWMTGAAVVVMAAVGFDTAFAPTLSGIIGNPVYGPGFFLGGFSPNAGDPTQDVWWSMGASYFNTGLVTGTYFLFETAFAAVTLALVGIIFFRKVKTLALGIYSVVYFSVIWNLPAAWIWNPTGWLARWGMVDFAGGLVVHGAAGAAGLGVIYQVWREERAAGRTATEPEPVRANPGWFTLGLLLLWVGWFGFNPGSVLAFNDEAVVVVLTTFIAAASGMVSILVCRHFEARRPAEILYAGNGVLMGLIIITPLAGFVSPGSAMILGLAGGPLYLAGEYLIGRLRWITDPVGLLPGHFLGGIFGITMIAVFAQNTYATASGFPGLPDGLLFGGRWAAIHQLGLEELGVAVVVLVVFVLSFVTMALVARALGGITTKSVAETAIWEGES